MVKKLSSFRRGKKCKLITLIIKKHNNLKQELIYLKI
jgi:hypothetical protein